MLLSEADWWAGQSNGLMKRDKWNASVPEESLNWLISVRYFGIFLWDYWQSLFLLANFCLHCLVLRNLEGNALTISLQPHVDHLMDYRWKGLPPRPVLASWHTGTFQVLLVIPEKSWSVLERLFNPCGGRGRGKRLIGLNGTGSWTANIMHSTTRLFCGWEKQQDFSDSDLFHFLYPSYSGKYPNMEIRLNLAQPLKIWVGIYALKSSCSVAAVTTCCYNYASTIKKKKHFRV